MNFINYLSKRWPDIVPLVVQHAQVVLIAVGIAVGIATVIGLALGVAIEGHYNASRLALAVTGTMLTTPRSPCSACSSHPSGWATPPPSLRSRQGYSVLLDNAQDFPPAIKVSP